MRISTPRVFPASAATLEILKMMRKDWDKSGTCLEQDWVLQEKNEQIYGLR